MSDASVLRMPNFTLDLFNFPVATSYSRCIFYQIQYNEGDRNASQNLYLEVSKTLANFQPYIPRIISIKRLKEILHEKSGKYYTAYRYEISVPKFSLDFLICPL